MSKASLNGKVRRGAAARTAVIAAWINSNVQKRLFAGRKSKVIAALCSKAVGFDVPVMKMARELDRAGVAFLRQPSDPPRRSFSKTEYLRANQRAIEERLERVEMKLFGKSFSRKAS